MKYYKPEEFKVGGYDMRDFWMAEMNGLVQRGNIAVYKNEEAADGKLYSGSIMAFQYNGKFYLDCTYVFAPLFPCYDDYSDSSYIAEFDTKAEANAFAKEVMSGYKYIFA